MTVLRLLPVLVAFSAIVLIAAHHPSALADDPAPGRAADLFSRDNLVAWCIVPFDAKRRGPVERAAMLEALGIRKLAYDYRAEHVPTFDAELEALEAHGIELTAWWFPTTLNDEARHILAVLERHGVRTQLWVTGGGGPVASPEEQQARVEAEVARLRPIAEAAAAIGCSVALYNHGGWFGEPENQIEVIRALDLPNVGIVYNLHHGHEHVDRFAELLRAMQPYLYALNLNGMVRGGATDGRKILPVGAGELDLALLRVIRGSGYRGPIGILNHTDLDAEARLADNIEGLEWLAARLAGDRAHRPPAYRSWAGEPAVPMESPLHDPALVAELVAEARARGEPRHGASVFARATTACLSCHRIGRHGGAVGPELAKIGAERTPEQIVESLFWPHREVAPEYVAITVVTVAGEVHTGARVREDATTIVLREPDAEVPREIARSDALEARETGSLMPADISTALSREEQVDLIRFLMEAGREEGLELAEIEELLAHAHHHAHAPATFPYERAPLDLAAWPSWQAPVNRDRLYDFYLKEAKHFRDAGRTPSLLPPFPGLDGGTYGHWGNQNEETWADGRWNETDLGTVQCGIFRGANVTVPRGVCVRLGERGELSACFDPDTLTYAALWSGGFVKLSAVRHGFLDGLRLDGTPLPRPEGVKPTEPFTYRGLYRHGARVVFAYRIGDVDYLDAPWVEDGAFRRVVAPAAEHPLRDLARGGGPRRWPDEIVTEIRRGDGKPYAVDTIELPVENPWNALMFCSAHDFLPDGSALVATMQGDVWRVSGFEASGDDTTPTTTARWRRFASGLHHPLGLVVDDDGIFVQGRDQLTRLVDLDGDGEADFHECISNAFETSDAGHDFVCGLERDSAGAFYLASGNQGLVRIAPDGSAAEVLATGFRNPGGLGLLPDGTITVPASEGEWTPASMVCAVRPPRDGEGEDDDHVPHFGYGGPRAGRPPELPLVYLPRGLDNSSGGQTYVSSERWGPLHGQLVHFSFGAGAHFLVLRDEVAGRLQGAVVPLPGELVSGAQRGRFHPRDGQLYVSGMAGWGAYTLADGSFQRVRYTGAPVQLPVGFHVHENGVLIEFSAPLDARVAGKAQSHFAQAWNYRYSSAYGSPEYSPRHPGTPGHDPLDITSAHVLEDERSLFLELPDLQPVNQLHLLVRVDAAEERELYLTVHALDTPFTGAPGYRPRTKTIAAHPILSDLALATKRVPNPWREPIDGARRVTMRTGANLTFVTRSFRARSGEALELRLENPDVVPHNWALVAPGALRQVGELSNRLIADPEAVARHYVPETSDVLVYTDVVPPGETFSVFFRAPEKPGSYPYLCTFPGHWMVMNGVMLVE